MPLKPGAKNEMESFLERRERLLAFVEDAIDPEDWAAADNYDEEDDDEEIGPLPIDPNGEPYPGDDDVPVLDDDDTLDLDDEDEE